jgi:hypothetical protein
MSALFLSWVFRRGFSSRTHYFYFFGLGAVDPPGLADVAGFFASSGPNSN